MKTFAELESLDLNWIKAKTSWWKPARYELTDTTGKVIASIQQESWNSKSTVDAPGNRWTFERKMGFFKPTRIVIKSIGTGEQPAEFIQKMTGGGTLTYPNGLAYLWKSGTWNQRWMWTTPAGDPVLGIELKGVWQSRGEVHIDPELAAQGKAPPLLLFLGWYLILLHQADMAAITAVTASTSVAST